jgi:hypothetical protein
MSGPQSSLRTIAPSIRAAASWRSRPSSHQRFGGCRFNDSGTGLPTCSVSAQVQRDRPNASRAAGVIYSPEQFGRAWRPTTVPAPETLECSIDGKMRLPQCRAKRRQRVSRPAAASGAGQPNVPVVAVPKVGAGRRVDRCRTPAASGCHFRCRLSVVPRRPIRSRARSNCQALVMP